MLRVMGTLFLCMGELIYAGGCGSYFANRGNEKTILLFWQVENMILLFLRKASPAINGRDLIVIRYVSLFWEWLYHLLPHPVKG